MAQEIDKIIKSKTAPKSNNVLWDDGENLKINRNGEWENTNTTEIKEGSIPLSALDDNIKSSIAYVGTLSVENPIITLQTYSKYLLNGEYIIYPGQTITLYGRLNIEYSVNTGTPKLIAHYVDNITVPISVHRSRDIHSFELPTSIANWNADKGEPGYIENKPFELWNKCGFTLGNGVNIIEVTSNARFICFNDMVIELPQFEDGTEFSIISGPPVSIKCTYIRGHAHLELIDPTNYFSKTTIEFYSNIKLINAIYLPDTIIKTTPQELSDTDKNQALTNLGIADLLEALKPVRLSQKLPTGNVTQEQLDEIGLTEKVINNILNGYTNKIYMGNTTYCVTYTDNANDSEFSEFIFATFYFNSDGIDTITQYRYRRYLDEITIESIEI